MLVNKDKKGKFSKKWKFDRADIFKRNKDKWGQFTLFTFDEPLAYLEDELIENQGENEPNVIDNQAENELNVIDNQVESELNVIDNQVENELNVMDNQVENELNVDDNVCNTKVDMDGIRMLDNSYFGDQFDQGCIVCGTPLLMKNVVKEVRKMAVSVLHIQCKKCDFVQKLQTGKSHSDPQKDNRSTIYDLNTKLAAGKHLLYSIFY